jgi:hypothetical protein
VQIESRDAGAAGPVLQAQLSGSAASTHTTPSPTATSSSFFPHGREGWASIWTLSSSTTQVPYLGCSA